MSRRPTLLTVVLLVSLAIQPAHAQQGPTQAELDAHERMLDVLDRASGGRTVWRVLESVS